ncbi:MAG: hypothetical protein O2856_09330, partial [Planctomycetota bacterium]|nr:hypothetical protein [Planctomycetota bacterium]
MNRTYLIALTRGIPCRACHLPKPLPLNRLSNLFHDPCDEAVKVAGSGAGAFAPLVHDGDFPQALEEGSQCRTNRSARGMEDH